METNSTENKKNEHFLQTLKNSSTFLCITNIKVGLGPHCPNIETREDKEKLYYIFAQFKNHPLFGQLIKEIYLGYFTKKDFEDADKHNLLFTEIQISTNDTELDLLYNYFAYRIIFIIGYILNKNKEDNEKEQEDLIKSITEKKKIENYNENKLFIYAFKNDFVKNNLVQLFELFEKLPNKNTKTTIQLLRIIIKENDTNLKRKELALFSPVGSLFGELYLKEIDFGKSIESFLIEVPKITLLLSLKKNNLEVSIQTILDANFFNREDQNLLISLLINENNQLMQRKMKLLDNEIAQLKEETLKQKAENDQKNELQDVEIAQLKAEKDQKNGLQDAEIDLLKTQNQKQMIINKNLQDQINSICLRDYINKAIDLFTSPEFIAGDGPYSIEIFKKYVDTLTLSEDKETYESFQQVIDCLNTVNLYLNDIAHNTYMSFEKDFSKAYAQLPSDRKTFSNKCLKIIENLSSVAEFNNYLYDKNNYQNKKS